MKNAEEQMWAWHSIHEKRSFMPKYFMPDTDKELGGGALPPVVDPINVEKTIDEIKAEAIAEAKKIWEDENKKRYNEAEKGIRLRLEKEAEKAKMTADERAKSEYEERLKALEEENKTYKQRELDTMRREAVTKANLPSYLANDVRLVNASPEELPNVIKAIAKDHNDWLTQNKVSQPTGVYLGTKKVLNTEERTRLAETDPVAYRKLRKEELYPNK